VWVFQSGLRNSESIIETHSPIIPANSGCAADMETGITVLLCVGKKEHG